MATGNLTETQVLRQHQSEGQGWPHDPWGDRYYIPTNRGAGHAKCTCGVLSEEEFDSSTQRRKWQREHRVQVLAEYLEGVHA